MTNEPKLIPAPDPLVPLDDLPDDRAAAAMDVLRDLRAYFKKRGPGRRYLLLCYDDLIGEEPARPYVDLANAGLIVLVGNWDVNDEAGTCVVAFPPGWPQVSH